MQVAIHDLELLNELTKKGDESRAILSSVLLTVYGAVVSGLFLLVTTNSHEKIMFSVLEKVLFIIISLSAVLVVFLSLTERIFNHFANTQIGQEHARRIRERKTGQINALSPTKTTIFILTYIPWALLVLVIINVSSIGIYLVVRAL